MARGGESDPEKMDMVPLVGPNAPRAPARGREACWLPSQSHPSARQGAVAGAASGGARGVARPTNAKGGRLRAGKTYGKPIFGVGFDLIKNLWENL